MILITLHVYIPLVKYRSNCYLEVTDNLIINSLVIINKPDLHHNSSWAQDLVDPYNRSSLGVQRGISVEGSSSLYRNLIHVSRQRMPLLQIKQQWARRYTHCSHPCTLLCVSRKGYSLRFRSDTKLKVLRAIIRISANFVEFLPAHKSLGGKLPHSASPYLVPPKLVPSGPRTPQQFQNQDCHCSETTWKL